MMLGGIGIGLGFEPNGSELPLPELADNVLHLRGDLGYTIDGANKLLAWADQSPANNDVNQAVGANQMLWVGGSRPFARCTASNPSFMDKIGNLGVLGSDGITLLAVVQSPTPGDVFICDGDGTYPSTALNAVAGNRTVTMAGQAQLSDGAWSTNLERWICTIQPSGGGANPVLIVDGVDTGLGTTGAWYTTATASFSIGRAAGFGAGFEGDIYELAAWKGPKTGADLTALIDYLAARYP